MSVTVVGSVALDTVETPHGKKDRQLGGSAVYASCAASYFGPVTLVGIVGRDFPSKHISFLGKVGIDLCGLNTVEGETFRWCGRYEGNMACAKTLDVRLNVFGKFFPELPECAKKGGFVFLANCSPRTQAHVIDQLDKPRFVLCDTMNYWIENDRKALLKTLARVDAVTMNCEEVCQLTGDHVTVAAAKKLLAMGPKYLIVKRGEHGASLFIRGGGCFAVPAFPLETVKDPTGAGDSFAGGFTGYLASAGAIGEKTLKRALVYGTVMASHAVQGFGIGRLGRLTRAEVESRFYVLRRMMSL